MPSGEGRLAGIAGGRWRRPAFPAITPLLVQKTLQPLLLLLCDDHRWQAQVYSVAHAFPTYAGELPLTGGQGGRDCITRRHQAPPACYTDERNDRQASSTSLGSAWSQTQQTRAGKQPWLGGVGPTVPLLSARRVTRPRWCNSGAAAHRARAARTALCKPEPYAVLWLKGLRLHVYTLRPVLLPFRLWTACRVRDRDRRAQQALLCAARPGEGSADI